MKLIPLVLVAALAQAATDFPIGRCVKVLGVTAPEDAQTVGFDYVELALQDMLPLSDADFATHVARIKALKILAISGYGFLPEALRIVGPEVDTKKVDGALRHGIDRAEKLGLKFVVYGNLLTKGRTPPDAFPPAEARKQLIDFGKRAATEAKSHGIIVLFEPMPARAGVMVNTVAEALALVRAVNSPNFQMLVDYGNFTTAKEDLNTLRQAAPYIRQVEIQNPNGRVYPQLPTESDYASFVKALKNGGYRGGFSIHGAPKNFFEDAPRAIAMLRQVVAP
jgi:D-psicose/D-tagatose/L-ribulose 3-epimerase